MAFKFALNVYLGVPGTTVMLFKTISLIPGRITSRRDYSNREPSYLLEWKDTHDNDAGVWFDESVLLAANAIVPTEPAKKKKSAAKRKR